MADERLLLYASSNGDRWWLCRGSGVHDVFVWHEPNAASGGLAARIDLGRFLSEVPIGPQHHALLRLVGSLAGRHDPGAPVRDPAPDAGAAAAEPTPGEELRGPRGGHIEGP